MTDPVAQSAQSIRGGREGLYPSVLQVFRSEAFISSFS